MSERDDLIGAMLWLSTENGELRKVIESAATCLQAEVASKKWAEYGATQRRLTIDLDGVEDQYKAMRRVCEAAERWEESTLGPGFRQACDDLMQAVQEWRQSKSKTTTS